MTAFEYDVESPMEFVDPTSLKNNFDISIDVKSIGIEPTVFVAKKINSWASALCQLAVNE